MCQDPACDSTEEPPPGEAWCTQRLRLEVVRWFTGHPMECGSELDLRPTEKG